MKEYPQFEGEFYTDSATRKLYATDASAYRELPEAVCIPKNTRDIVTLVHFAKENDTSIIPRTAGTSLAGQVVGSGVILDISKHFNQILEVNPRENWVRVQPGIVRDDLNRALKEHGLFFAPETSTANRAMIGGMIGNNSCGANSVVYQSTREHLLEVKAILADGSEVVFGSESDDVFKRHCEGLYTSGNLHAQIYRNVQELLQIPGNQESIHKGFPDRKIPRRNTGYALDLLLRHSPFSEGGDPFNFCTLLAGSEGTLAIVTEAKLKLSPLPPAEKALVAIHCESIDQSLHANLVALKYSPTACELMDHYILEATKRNILYRENRFFLEGDPQAILVVEISKDNKPALNDAVKKLITELRSQALGYAFPIIEGDDIPKVWNLRKAGLGLLSNVPGDAKPAPVIEDTAVDVRDLPAYIKEFNGILEKYGLYSVHYAHAGSGELHLRPILDLKSTEGVSLYRTIAEEIARLVKKYDGSLSGEHGDGRLRAEFIPQMLGDKNYALLRQVKKTWDPHGIFNRGKIVDAPPMDTHLRFDRDQKTRNFDTLQDFSETQGYLRAAEMCNGSGDCRKTALSGGTMCPSYMATKDEKDTTRARANILREVLTRSKSKNPFDSEDIKAVLDLCLSCKGCKSECPSNVDLAKMKSEWQYQYYKSHGVPWRTHLIGNFTTLMKLASVFPRLYQWVFNNDWLARPVKQLIGFARERSMPALANESLRKWFATFNPSAAGKEVYFFCDEFTNFNDVEVGKKAILLLDKLGYQVRIVKHRESGRSYLSKGLLNNAKKIARENVLTFSPIINSDTPLVGLEPSAILTFRDEYASLLRGNEQKKASQLSKNVFTIEEFLAREMDQKKINKQHFKKRKQLIKVHGHCHQKALSSMTPTKKILSLPEGSEVQMIPSGCCGMAGSFGYEKEHFDISLKIGELVLFPTVRKQPKEVVIVASGTSCRHQIKDGTAREAIHPVEFLFEALKNEN